MLCLAAAGRQSREGVQQAGEAQRQALQHLSDQGSTLRARASDLEGQLAESRRQLLQARAERDGMEKEVQVRKWWGRRRRGHHRVSWRRRVDGWVVTGLGLVLVCRWRET